MKYLFSEASYLNRLNCENNLFEAYKRLGELDPFNIKKYKLTILKKDKKASDELTDKQLIQRGILNVRKALNRNLGKSGKFSNKMLRKTAEIVVRTSNNTIYLGADLPKKSYIKITNMVYNMLYVHDPDLCTSLLNIESKDDYPAQDMNRFDSTKAITPIQTNICLRSDGRTDEAREFFDSIRELMF